MLTRHGLIFGLLIYSIPLNSCFNEAISTALLSQMLGKRTYSRVVDPIELKSTNGQGMEVG